MTSMTKHILVRKNMTGNRGQDAEEESSASEGKTETVGKPTGKAPDTQNVWDITETVTEEKTMEEIPPNTWEQAPQRLSPERCEVTGESSNHTGKVRQQEVTNKSPPDHASDQEDEEDTENLSEVNPKADQMEFTKEFQEFMNEAIDRLLKKPARNILAGRTNLSRARNRESLRKPYARKQKCFHQEMSAENLMTSETVEFH